MRTRLILPLLAILCTLTTALAGYVERTVAASGDTLVVFNWSPVQWDEADRQDHYTLRVVSPGVIPSGDSARAFVDSSKSILTEPFVNKKFLIDYRAGPDNRLMVLFHKRLRSVGDDDAKRADILRFMVAVKQFMEGSLNAFTDNPAVEKSLFDMRFSTLPVLSEIALTYRCNLRCAFCYAGCNCTRNDRDSSELSTPQAKRVLDVLFHEAQVPSVSFTGGEPTLVPALTQLIAYAKKLGMRVNLITNGTLIDNRLSCALAHSGLDSAQVSIEGVTAQSHDALVGSAGAFERSVAAVGHLHAQGIRVHSNTTITARNIDDCIAMPRFVAETLQMPQFSMNMVIPTGSGAVNDGVMVRYSEVGEILDRIMLASRARNVEFMWYSPVSA
jgi:organic radical activating enzyme